MPSTAAAANSTSQLSSHHERRHAVHLHDAEYRRRCKLHRRSCRRTMLVVHAVHLQDAEYRRRCKHRRRSCRRTMLVVNAVHLHDAGYRRRCKHRRRSCRRTAFARCLLPPARRRHRHTIVRTRRWPSSRFGCAASRDPHVLLPRSCWRSNRSVDASVDVAAGTRPRPRPPRYRREGIPIAEHAMRRAGNLRFLGPPSRD